MQKITSVNARVVDVAHTQGNGTIVSEVNFRVDS